MVHPREHYWCTINHWSKSLTGLLSSPSFQSDQRQNRHRYLHRGNRFASLAITQRQREAIDLALKQVDQLYIILRRTCTILSKLAKLGISVPIITLTGHLPCSLLFKRRSSLIICKFPLIIDVSLLNTQSSSMVELKVRSSSRCMSLNDSSWKEKKPLMWPSSGRVCCLAHPASLTSETNRHSHCSL